MEATPDGNNSIIIRHLNLRISLGENIHGYLLRRGSGRMTWLTLQGGQLGNGCGLGCNLPVWEWNFKHRFPSTHKCVSRGGLILAVNIWLTLSQHWRTLHFPLLFSPPFLREKWLKSWDQPWSCTSKTYILLTWISICTGRRKTRLSFYPKQHYKN